MLDSSLLRRLQHRDQDALEALTNKYRSYVCTIISNMITGTGTYSDVEELCDDAFLAVWQNADTIEAGKLKAYLGTTARNKAKSWLRTRRELPMDLDEIEIPDESLPLEEKAIQAELAKRLRQAIDAMRPKDREIFLRYYYYLENTDTIAARMDIPAATVRSRLARGREQLKNTLCKEDWP